ncbi:hypothetical protein [Catellatospora bangladeshensis]|uniref:Transglycosylase SLT domain-containing protein n=1 Tax=Catellatospora bangladeshensis TaxID=310355 RepID=A0A8J3JM60_9ACTN|nr:hypothetical protein [Catellatospora bangladeshensis]GIF80479.1 hypothetical protein Cba03nite_18280 [Catellatospora bangladeshensis]
MLRLPLAARLAAVTAVTIVLSGCATAATNGTDPVFAGPAPTTVAPAGSAAASPVTAPTASAGAGPSPSKSAAAAPSRFTTLKPGSKLPSGSQCAAWVRARPKKENKGANRTANRTTGHRVDPAAFGDGAALAKRVDGQFTGTTEEILRWAACKWGVDEDIVKAQAAIESWWRQGTLGDFDTDAAACPAGHGLGADGQAGKCPQSYGILQNRYPYMKSAFPGAMRSTAMSADLAYAVWRSCFEGREGWLNTVERGREYAAGDAWGCVGRWFSGRWHTAPGEQYVGRVRDYLDRRIWQTPDFQQP